MAQSVLESKIPKFYKRPALNLLMYGYVSGARSALHTISVKTAIDMFMDDYNISPDDYNIDSAQVIYSRMCDEYGALPKE